MRDFACPKCGQRLAFENSQCLHCGSTLRFALPTREFVVLDADGPGAGTTTVNDVVVGSCANLKVARCNWTTPVQDELCFSCWFTRTRPADSDAEGMVEFANAEQAKRRLFLELTELGLPLVDRQQQPENGLAFDLLSSVNENIITGHDTGLITLDLAEGDDAHREKMRQELAEPYRTLLGHFRHEVGHYFQEVLVGAGEHRPRFEELFGDPDTDYQASLDRHYSEGAPAGWEKEYVSSYATMHPAEDWAETFAHYLHIRDTLDTAAAFGLAPAAMTLDGPIPGKIGFERIIDLWLPMAWSLNMINRSMGHNDLYPFVLRGRVLEKMLFVHDLINGSAD